MKLIKNAAIPMPAAIVAALFCSPKPGAVASSQPKLTNVATYIQLLADSQETTVPAAQYHGRAVVGEGMKRGGVIESWSEITDLLLASGYAVPQINLDSNLAFLEFSSIVNSEMFTALQVYVTADGHPHVSQRVERCYGGETPDSKRAFTLVVMPKPAIGAEAGGASSK